VDVSQNVYEDVCPCHFLDKFFSCRHDGSTIKNPDIFSVFVGFNSIPREAERECEGIFRVKKIRVHPLYSKPSGSRFYDLNDIAVIELSVPVDLDNNPCACAICLDNIKEPMPGELCTLSGFGCPVPIFATEACPG
jgi:Trypsin